MIVLTAALASLLVLSAFIAWRFRVTRSILEPGIVFAANLIVLYPLRLLMLAAFGDEARPGYVELLGAGPLERAGWLALLGSVAFVTGYAMVSRRSRPAVLDARFWRESREDVRIVWLFLSLSVVGTAYMIATGDYISYLMGQNRNPAIQHVAYLFSSLQWAAFVAAWILAFRAAHLPWVRLTLIVVNAIVIPYQFVQGSKTFLSLLVVSIFFAYVWTRRRFPAMLAVAGVAFVALFVFPFVTQFREFVNAEYGEIPSIVQFRLKELTELDVNRRYERDEWWTPAMVISARYAGIDELYNLDYMVPDTLDYRYGQDYLAMIYNVVPRFLWPSKPQFSRGADYGAALRTSTAVTPFPYGEALWQFGALGLAPMMAIWGALLATVVRAFGWMFTHSRQQLFVAAIFLSQIYWIAGGESSMAAVLSGVPQQIVLYGSAYLLSMLLTARRSPRRAESPA